MSTEFYEQIGVDRGASGARIRQAYGQAVSRLARRRRALVEQGGDTSSIDLQRTTLDEAWTVLQDPVRRRRYDALIAWSEGKRTHDPDVVWEEVSEALVHPAAALAAKLLRVTSKLQEIGQLPLAPSGAAEEPPTLVPHDDDLTSPRPLRLGPQRPTLQRAAPTLPPPPAEERPSQATTTPRFPSPPTTGAGDRLTVRPTAALRAGAASTMPPSSIPPELDDDDLEPLPDATPAPAPSSPPRIELKATRPPATPRLQALPPEKVAALVDDLGYGGRLLSTVRERLGLSVRDVADHTRISVKYLEALESEARDQLPSSTFVRGYVREVARVLQLDPDAVVAGYMRRYDGA